jgi:hypothetical protein
LHHTPPLVNDQARIISNYSVRGTPRLGHHARDNRSYYLLRAGSPQSEFYLVEGGIPGQAGTTSCTDTNNSPPPPYFYRVLVIPPYQPVQAFPPPPWLIDPKTSSQVTDRYLADLAAKHGLKFATLDGQLKHPAVELVR